MPDDRLFPSKYGQSRMVTGAQYLAELMCERRARVEKKILPPSFWKDPFWSSVYRQQIAAVNRLIKRIDPEKTGSGISAISVFLRSDHGKKCYSLAGAWIFPFIEQAHKVVLERQNHKEAITMVENKENTCGNIGPRPAFSSGDSTRSKLEGL